MNAIFLTLGIFFVTVGVLAQPQALPPKNLHLYLLAGQLNMAERGTVEAQDRTPHPRVWVLNQQNEWVPATEPLQFDKPAVVGVGPGLSFGKAMAEADPTANIGLIPVAVGGSAIDAYRVVFTNKPTLTPTKTPSARGILWHQGESDSKPERAAVYSQKLGELSQRFRREAGAEVPVTVGALGDFYIAKNPSAATVNQFLENLPDRVPRTDCVEATGLTDNGDQTHFNAASARELGRRYAAAMRKFQPK